MPQHAILRFQYPVVFVRIDKQFGRNATHHGCIEGGQCLVGKDAEVLLSVDAEDRGVPFVDEEMRGVGKSALCRSVVLGRTRTDGKSVVEVYGSVVR